jgi:hypothetical protein
MSEDIGSLIDQARKAGHSDKQIYEHLSTSVNPEYQKFARKNAQQFGVTAPPPTVENIASDAWDLANQPLGATGITPLKVAEASLVPAAGYAAYKYAKSQNAKPETPALSDEDLVHQRLIKQEELRSLKLNNDVLERKLNPIAQPTPVVQPSVPNQTPAAPSFGKGTDMPLNPFTTDIKKIAEVTNPTALGEVATSKPFSQPVKPPDIATRVRRTAEEIAAAKAEALANAPKGMRPVPPNSKYNKAPGEKIGVGGYTYAHGAYGPETQARWEEQYGKTNVPYEKVKSDISLAQMGPQKEGVSNEFQFSRPKYAPNYIKGAVSPEMLNAVLNKANVAGALMTPTTASAPTVQDYKKQNQGRGALNPKDVDPTEWGDKYAAFLKIMQSMVGDKTPYLYR